MGGNRQRRANYTILLLDSEIGLVGLEVIHSDHDAVLVEKYTRFAERFGLLKTGGSDFHGTNKKDIRLGTANGRQVPFAFLEALLERHQELRRAG